MSTPLIIKVKRNAVPNGDLGKWTDMSGHIKDLTKDIDTSTIKENADIAAQVSGIPTAYARANLFKSALAFDGQPIDEADKNLNVFYEMLSTEWRGFIACIALDYSRLKAERIYLQYSDGKSIGDTANLYEPMGTFGNMLFNRRPLWSEKPEETDEKHRNVPFLEIIKYDDIVVGATSPESLLFTACTYKLKETENRPWVDYQTGRFRDPVPTSTLDKTQTLQLYAYINYLIEGNNNDGVSGVNGLEHYYSYLPSMLRPNYGNINGNLARWRKEIEAYAEDKNFKLEEASIPPINLFEAPFNIAFNYKDELWAKDGTIYCKDTDSSVKFNPKELLLPDTAKIARLIIKGPNRNDPSQFPLYVMAADKKNEPGEKAYFALPLSPMGLKAFGKNVGALVEPLSSKANVDSRLTAIYDPNAEKNNLEVTLHLDLNDGRTKEMKATYTCGGEIDGKELIMWPNFISKRWHRYFLYSELPHNVNLKNYPFQAFPFVGDELHDFTIIEDKEGQPLYLAKDGHDVDYDFVDPIDGSPRHVETSLHLVSNSATADNPYKYEVYECNHPFMGVKLNLPDGKPAGFLIIKYRTSENNPAIPKDKLGIQDNGLRGTTLGVDFGSTNTSIAYLDPIDQQPKGIQFANRRVALLRAGEKSTDEVADESHLFFFQANPLLSNSIKSTLTLHNSGRVTKDINETQEIAKFQKEVKGGFPCFSRNLPVDKVESRYIRLNTAKCGIVEQAYNMKWDDDDRNKAYKMAFLRSLLLQVYAELFDKDLFPRKLKWSYPSSMSESMLTKYNAIWQTLKDVNPLNDVNNHEPLHHDEKLQLKVSDFGYNLNIGGGGSTSESFVSSNPLLSDNPLLGGNPLLSGNPLLGETASGSTINSLTNNPLLESEVSALAEKKPVEFEKDDDSKHIAFKPIPMVDGYSFQSMTEASAVANYLSNKVTRDDLTICFDIGGSTTDISALCQLNTPDGARLTMIKQNSIHFAAQLIGKATGYCPNFEKVLLMTCQQFGLRIEGLNQGKHRYSKDTASYYFEQMVDRLDANQLTYFYSKIGSECGELLCVDLYVTGLSLYYAGILARKLIKQVRNSEESRWGANGKPKVTITFAGKGARIMEWLSVATNDPVLAKNYYQGMFIKGIGQNEIGQYISDLQIDFPKSVTNDVKFEVSKGLAMESTQLMCPQNSDPIEVIGEDGFTIEDKTGQTVVLDADNSITKEMMASLGDKFYGESYAGTRFQDFLGLFLQVAQRFFGMRVNPNELRDALKNMQLLTFIHDTPEYKHAQRAETFDFVSPILILEGLKFYEDFLLKNIGQE